VRPHAGSLRVRPGLVVGRGQPSGRTPVPRALTRRLGARTHARTPALPGQEAVSRTSRGARVPRAAASWPPHLRQMVGTARPLVAELLGRTTLADLAAGYQPPDLRELLAGVQPGLLPPQ
jgi:hypothetical protein